MSTERRILLWLLLFVFFGAALYVLRGALFPFVAGMAVAYLLDPVADRMERIGIPRTVASLLIVLVFVLAIIAILVVLVPILTEQVSNFVARAPDYATQLRMEAEPILRRLRSHLTPGQAAQIEAAIRAHMGDLLGWAGKLLTSILTGGAALLGVLGIVFIMPVVAFYLIRDWDRIVAYIDTLLPEKEGESIRDIAREIDDRLSGFVRGQAIVCLLLGTWYAAGLALVGVDFGLLVGVSAGILSIVPYLGNFVGLGISLLLAAAQFDDWLPPLLVLGVFISGQVLEGNFVSPKIVGERVGLHPVWLLFAVTAGGTLLGITGALLAVPSAAAIGVIVRHGVDRYRRSALYTEPAPPSEDATGEQ